MGQALACYFTSKSKPGSREFKAGEFYGHYLPAPEQSDNEMLAAMKAFAAIHNKRIKEG